MMTDSTEVWQSNLPAATGNFNTMHTFEGDGNPDRAFEINFSGGYISESHVKAYMMPYGTADYEYLNITFVNESTVRLSAAVPEGWVVTIYRDTPKDVPLASFTDGALITAASLDRNAEQAIFGVAEMVDRFSATQGNVDLSLNIANEAKDASDAAVGTAQVALAAANAAIRVPAGETVNPAPNAADRAGKILAFNQQGDVVVVLPESGSASDVMLEYAKPTGASLVGSGSGTVQSALDSVNAAVTSVSDTVGDLDAQLPGKVSGTDLANNTSVVLGDALVGVRQPFTGAVARTQHSKNLDVVHISDFGGVADGVTDNAPAFAAAVTHLKTKGGGTLHLGAGTYLLNSQLDLRGAFVSLKGAGQYTTKLKAGFTGDALINLYETEDARISPVTIEDMFVDGSGTVGRVLTLRFRHYTKFTNVIFSGGTNSAVHALDTWLTSYVNCGFESSLYGLYLEGANHRNACYSCSFQGNSARNLIVRSAATANDGNTALYFANCDFEFSAGLGIDFQGSDMTLDCCYLGENLEAAVIQVYSGTVKINGGVLFYGHTEATYLAYMSGGVLIVDGATINGQGNASLGNLAVGAGGKMAIRNCTCNFPLGGNSTIAGDVLLSLNDKQVFAPRYGLDYTGFGVRASVSDIINGNDRTVAATTVPGPSPVIGFRAPLYTNHWRQGEPLALIVTYASNADFKVRVAQVVEGDGVVIGTLPPTGGAISTAVIYTTMAPARNPYTILEVYRDGVVAQGHTLTLRSVTLGDSVGVGLEFGGVAGNIYKF